MSDFILTTNKHCEDLLSNNILSIYDADPPVVQAYQGDWGSLVVSQGHYKGFQPFETDKHILVVIGGPVLYFQDNDFLTEDDSQVASKAIYERWIIEQQMQWDEDLSGPFSILLIDKLEATYTVVTDLMAIIPVYKFQQDGEVFISTHVSALAKSANRANLFDTVSLLDFILNDIVTFPYTAYQQIYQVAPSSVVRFTNHNEQSEHYWLPEEKQGFNTIEEAADYFKQGIEGNINRITEKMQGVAQFISGGEDSRALAGLLANKKKRDAFIFLNNMNREGHIAKKVCEIYGADLSIAFREETHYFDILAQSSHLVGMGHQYFHAHSLQFDKQFRLKTYSAVFGGFLSDTLLKGNHVKFFRGYYRAPYLPQIEAKNHKPITAKMRASSQFFNQQHIHEVIGRRSKHMDYVKSIRPNTHKEWFSLWPLSMYNDMTNFYSTRRLFSSYEPYMCKEAIKTCAAVPTSWKLNRRLFRQSMQTYLKASKWLIHADGRLPYFKWWVSIPVQFAIRLYRSIAVSMGLIKGNQGSWGDWNVVMKSQAWRDSFDSHKQAFAKIGLAPEDRSKLSKDQQVNLLQVLHQIDEK